MVVIFYIIIAKCSYKVRIVCFICIQIKIAASLSAFFHAAGDKVFKKCFLVCADYIRKVGVEMQIILIVVDSIILRKLLSKRRVLQSHTTIL